MDFVEAVKAAKEGKRVCSGTSVQYELMVNGADNMYIRHRTQNQTEWSVWNPLVSTYYVKLDWHVVGGAAKPEAT